MASSGEKNLIPLFDGDKEIGFDRLIQLYIYRYKICVCIYITLWKMNNAIHPTHPGFRIKEKANPRKENSLFIRV